MPMKVFRDLPVDPLASITSALAKMQPGEAAAIQILIRPAPEKWKEMGKHYISGVKKNESNPEKAKYDTDAKTLEMYYVSEPILAEAAADYMYNETTLNQCLEQLNFSAKEKLVDLGERGEVVAQFILLKAFDQCYGIRSIDKPPLVRVDKYIKNLFGNNIMGIENCEKLKESEIYNCGWLCFNNFISDSCEFLING